MMNCREVRELFSPFFDGELSGSPRREEFLLHLGGCVPCRQEYDRFTRAIGLLRKEGMVAPPAGFKPSIMERVRGFAAQRGRGMTERRFAPPSPFLIRWLPAAATLAILVIGGLLILVVMGRSEIERLNSLSKKNESAGRVETATHVDADKMFALLMKEKGYEQIQGMWLKSDEVRKIRDGFIFQDGLWRGRDEVISGVDQRTLEKLLAARGFVPHGGTWISRETKEKIDQGMVLIEGRWTARKDLMERMLGEAGFVKSGGEWVATNPPTRRPPESKGPVETPLSEKPLSQPLFEGIVIGEPVSYKGMTLFPLRRREVGTSFAGVSLADADRQRTVSVVEDAKSRTCSIANNGAEALFCSGGEIINGTAGDWTIVEDTVIPPGSSKSFAVRGMSADNPDIVNNGSPRGTGLVVSAAMQRLLGQECWDPQLWSHAARIGSAFGAVRKGDYAGLHASTDVRNTLSAYREAFHKALNDATVGVVAMSGNDLLLCEIFSDHALLKRRFDDIVTGLTLDHELARRTLKAAAAPKVSVADLQRAAAPILGKLSLGKSSGDVAPLLWESRRVGGITRSGDVAVHTKIFFESDFWGRVKGPVVYPVSQQRLNEVVREYKDIMKKGALARQLWAVEEIACIDAADVADLLVDDLHHPEESVRGAAVQAIGERKDPKMEALLIGELKKGRVKPQDFRYVVKAVGGLGSDKAVGALINHLGSCDYESARVVVEELPPLFAGLKNGRLLEEGMNRLVEVQERMQVGRDLPYVMTPYQQALLIESIQKTLKAVTRQDFRSPIDYHRWWNSNREKFLLQYEEPPTPRGDERGREKREEENKNRNP